MTAAIIDGKAFAARLRQRVAAEVADLAARHGLVPGLAVVLVGDDPASDIYVRSKGRLTREAGMHSEEHRLPAATPEAELLALIDRLNRDPRVHGILVQLPLARSHRRGAGDRRRGARRRTWTASTPRTSGGWPADGTPPCPARPLGCLMLLRDQLGDLAGPRGGGARPLEHRRPADGAAAPARELHGDGGALAHPRPGRGLRPRRHPGDRGRPARASSPRLGSSPAPR